MKKMFKGLGLSLCTVLLLAGCSCSKDDNSVIANVSNGETAIATGLNSGTKSYNIQDIYDDLKSSLGNETAANELLKTISDLVLNKPIWQDRKAELENEKLMELVNSGDYDFEGEFDEELLVAALRAQSYDIPACTTYGPTVSNGEIKYLECDYTDYIERGLQVEVLTQLLNEKYVYDKVMDEKKNLLTTKKARIVEYISIDSSADGAFDFITNAVNELAASNSQKTLLDVANDWKQKLLDKVEENFDKLNTKDDANGTLMNEFTGGYMYSADEGKQMKIDEINNNDTIYQDVVITSDKKDILNSTLVERLLSDNVLDEKVGKTKLINGSYYLVSPLAGSTIKDSDIRITDKANSKYYLVKVTVVEADEDATKDELYADENVYRAVKVLATNSSLVSGSASYYLEQYKDQISVHDEEVYAYLKAQYRDIFAD